jgi:hypothetical protein
MNEITELRAKYANRCLKVAELTEAIRAWTNAASEARAADDAYDQARTSNFEDGGNDDELRATAIAHQDAVAALVNAEREAVAKALSS